MTQHRFTTPAPVTLDVENGSGRVAVHAGDVTETTVTVSGRHAEEVEVRHEGDVVAVRVPRTRLGFFSGDQSLDVDVMLPTGSRLDLRVGSAQVTSEGPVGEARVRSGSGDVTLDEVSGSASVETGSGTSRVGRVGEDLAVRSGSGSVAVREVGGTLNVMSGSGDVTVGTAGSKTVVRTGSGDLELGETSGAVTLTTGSGDLTVRHARAGRLSAKGGSGDVRVAVPRGLPVWTDITSMTGRVRSDLESVGAPAEGDPHLEVLARTMSGDVVLTHV
ncbi:DUF4097 family beta strand repeat protein [Nocardioides sp. HDW12B]|uniref:DUF4097 family beta strand repeat-containing protein n=1 Tax=Nocardioides sp. HDW12B TaxID=2714939 RepID=UPI00140CF4CB|nr:DUF4097 family beta strand repeat-containing protein [Nocardioides sp. HDW12B]QIK66140.1 DUF4097 family beta strand repeat protein [Nocardioides sp. HDW12B]